MISFVIGYDQYKYFLQLLLSFLTTGTVTTWVAIFTVSK